MSIRRRTGQTGTSPPIADGLRNSAQESAAPTTVSRSVPDRWHSPLPSGRGPQPTARRRSAATSAGAGTATRPRHDAARRSLTDCGLSDAEGANLIFGLVVGDGGAPLLRRADGALDRAKQAG